jgi:hypothetical protein
MHAIAYQFHVLPRHRDNFLYGYFAARDSLCQALGLVTHELARPRDRHGAFTLMFAWDSRASFERFTRTWLGVWLLNGMGLDRHAFAAPIETVVGSCEAPPPARSRRAD